jgi:sugar lactone lactonase YvrE
LNRKIEHGAAAMDWQVIGETRDRLGESALWHPTEAALYWIDYYGPHIHRYDPATGETRHWTPAGTATIGSLAFAADGCLLLALDGGVHLFDPKSEELMHFADPNQGRPGIGYNDAKIDRDRRYWVGTFDLAERSPRGMLYRLEAEGRAIVGDSGFVVCNGPAFSPAGDRLYFSDSVGRQLLAYDLDRATGALSMPSLVVQFGEGDGMPDGLCVDSAGALYCAHYGGGRVSRFAPDGALLGVLPLPMKNVTSCCLGGPALDTLYVTTAENGGAHPLDGALFACTVETPGLPEPLWRR